MNDTSMIRTKILKLTFCMCGNNMCRLKEKMNIHITPSTFRYIWYISFQNFIPIFDVF